MSPSIGRVSSRGAPSGSGPGGSGLSYQGMSNPDGQSLPQGEATTLSGFTPGSSEGGSAVALLGDGETVEINGTGLFMVTMALVIDGTANLTTRVGLNLVNAGGLSPGFAFLADELDLLVSSDGDMFAALTTMGWVNVTGQFTVTAEPFGGVGPIVVLPALDVAFWES